MEFTLNELRQLIREAANAAYDILGVSKNSSFEEIKHAYRQKAIALHPDRNPGIDTTSKMAKLNVAYSILSDPAKRSKYNMMGDRTVDAEIPAPRSEPQSPFSGGSWGSPKQKASPFSWEKKEKKKRPASDENDGRKGSRKTRETVDDPYQVQYFTYVKGTSNKFWSIQLTPTAGGEFDVMVRWGRIGTAGQNKLFYFSNLGLARNFIRAKITEKLSKGYVRSDATGSKKEAPKTKQEVPPQSPTPENPRQRKQRTSYKVYGPHHGKPASAHFGGHIYTPQGGQTKFKPGMRANMGLGSDGRLGVNDPETGATEAWNIDESVMHDMLIECVLRHIDSLL